MLPSALSPCFAKATWSITTLHPNKGSCSGHTLLLIHWSSTPQTSGRPESTLIHLFHFHVGFTTLMNGLPKVQVFLMIFNELLTLHSSWCPVSTLIPLCHFHLHSQKQSAHWAVDVTAQVVPCWLGSWLNCNLWLVLGQWNQLSLHHYWMHSLLISTESWLKWWYTVGWAISSESVTLWDTEITLHPKQGSCSAHSY